MRVAPTRRNILIGAGGAVVVASGVFVAARLLGNRHAPTPYDDLLVQLEDRDDGAEIGRAMLAEADQFDPNTVAAALRARLARTKLAQAAAEDAVGGRLMEARGWVLPETVALLAVLAAKAAP